MRRQKRPEKRTCQKLHAYKRIKQRFGIEMRREEYDDLIRQINTSQTTGVHETCRVSHHAVKVRGQEMVAVYDRQRNTITTFLTREMSEDRLGVSLPSSPRGLKVKKLQEAPIP